MSIPPTLAYLGLLGSLFVSLLAMLTPGTGVLEIIALLGWSFTAYAVYQLGLNFWALVLLLLSLVSFGFSLRAAERGRRWLVGVSLLGMALASMFLFPNPTGGLWPPAVNPWVALFTSLVFGLGLWIGVEKVRQALGQRPSHSLDTLIGQIGEARTRIHHEGAVYVGGELWSARSDSPIPAGRAVRVLRREGFILIVEEVR